MIKSFAGSFTDLCLNHGISSFLVCSTSSMNQYSSVSVKPQIILASQILALAESHTTLNCSVSGYPKSRVSWKRYHAGQETVLPTNIQYENDRSVLIINRALPKDSGVYKCIAENTAGIAEATTILFVQAQGM